jgi:hypothetical protein
MNLLNEHFQHNIAWRIKEYRCNTTLFNRKKGSPAGTFLQPLGFFSGFSELQEASNVFQA